MTAYSRTLKEALEDAHGVISEFVARPAPADDCMPAVREAITALDVSITHALQRAEDQDTIAIADQRDVDDRALALLTLWSNCGERTQSLLLDLRNVLGKYITIAPRTSEAAGKNAK